MSSIAAPLSSRISIWLLGLVLFCPGCGVGRSDPARTEALFPGAPYVVQNLELVENGDAVFFVGNSFFGWKDRILPHWVAALGREMIPPITIETGSDIVFGNTPLGNFLHHDATRRAIASGKYDVFVLQGEEFEPVHHKERFHQAVRDFHRAVTDAGGRLVLFMTWEFRWEPFLPELASSYDEIGEELGIPVIPVGLIYDDCRLEPPRGKSGHWLTSDSLHPMGGLHPNAMGAAVSAYATFGMLTGVNPQGTNFEATGNSNNDEMMKTLSAKSWARVAPRLRK